MGHRHRRFKLVFWFYAENGIRRDRGYQVGAWTPAPFCSLYEVKNESGKTSFPRLVRQKAVLFRKIGLSTRFKLHLPNCRKTGNQAPGLSDFREKPVFCFWYFR